MFEVETCIRAVKESAENDLRRLLDEADAESAVTIEVPAPVPAFVVVASADDERAGGENAVVMAERRGRVCSACSSPAKLRAGKALGVALPGLSDWTISNNGPTHDFLFIIKSFYSTFHPSQHVQPPIFLRPS